MVDLHFMADYPLSHFPLAESHTKSKSKVEANLPLPHAEQNHNIFFFMLDLNTAGA